MAKLYFYYSAMNAGKTTALLQSAHNYHERGMRTLILTPQLDDRYGKGVVQSRIGLKANGRVFWRAKDGESACCTLRLELRRPGRRQVIPLARTKGAAAIPKGYWSVTVVARDAAGNATREQLGLVVGHARPKP